MFWLIVFQCSCFVLQDGGRYTDLFVYSLKYFGILCIGLHRFRDTKDSPMSASCKRFVITNPPDDFKLLSTDMVSILYADLICSGVIA